MIAQNNIPQNVKITYVINMPAKLRRHGANIRPLWERKCEREVVAEVLTAIRWYTWYELLRF
jgi:hypothetical protein